MPLAVLDIGGTPVSDLSPLKGMKSDDPQYPRYEGEHAFAIEGLPIERAFTCSNNQISDLSPLKGDGFDAVGPFRHERIRPFAARRDAAFDACDCHDSKVTDLKPLQGMPLKTLLLDGTQVADLSPLRGMPLIFPGSWQLFAGERVITA